MVSYYLKKYTSALLTLRMCLGVRLCFEHITCLYYATFMRVYLLRLYSQRKIRNARLELATILEHIIIYILDPVPGSTKDKALSN